MKIQHYNILEYRQVEDNINWDLLNGLKLTNRAVKGYYPLPFPFSIFSPPVVKQKLINFINHSQRIHTQYYTQSMLTWHACLVALQV